MLETLDGSGSVSATTIMLEMTYPQTAISQSVGSCLAARPRIARQIHGYIPDHPVLGVVLKSRSMPSPKPERISRDGWEVQHAGLVTQSLLCSSSRIHIDSPGDHVIIPVSSFGVWGKRQLKGPRTTHGKRPWMKQKAQVKARSTTH